METYFNPVLESGSVMADMDFGDLSTDFTRDDKAPEDREEAVKKVLENKKVDYRRMLNVLAVMWFAVIIITTAEVMVLFLQDFGDLTREFIDPDFAMEDDGLNMKDLDNDGLSDIDENSIGTNPVKFDSDDDGLPDGWEFETATMNEIGERNIDPLNETDAWEDPDRDSYDANRNGVIDPEELFSNLREFQLGLDHNQDYIIRLKDGECTDPNNPDTDGDGMSDGYEDYFGLDPLDDGDTGTDSDGDGLTNLEEFILDTDPKNQDTDGDGIDDYTEVNTDLNITLDGIQGTDPANHDTDGDGMDDGWEIEYDLDPLDFRDLFDDKDVDGLPNVDEFKYDTDPLKMDTDNDGLPDGYEVRNRGELRNGIYQLDPKNPLDATRDNDGDNLTNLDEYNVRELDHVRDSTDPNNPDTDNDGLTDYEEVVTYLDNRPNPLRADSDLDLLLDGEEVKIGFDIVINGITYHRFTNASNPDTDADGLTDAQEVLGYHRTPRGELKITGYPTDPTEEDTDGDGLVDKVEIVGYSIFVNDAQRNVTSNATRKDTDGDNLNDGDEANSDFDLAREGIQGTDPSDTDLDGDGVPDGWDTDGDGVPDGFEYLYSDMDGDGIPTYWEVENNMDPRKYDADEDIDQDGLKAWQEYLNRTDPGNPDSNGNGIQDGDEILEFTVDVVYFRPVRKLLDNEGKISPINGTDQERDFDGDGLTNFEEFNSSHKYDRNPDSEADNGFWTNPVDPDSDGDGLPDSYEYFFGKFDPGRQAWTLDPNNPEDAELDPDNDGPPQSTSELQSITNDPYFKLLWTFPVGDGSSTFGDHFLMDTFTEYKYGTNPSARDTNFDDLPDWYEIYFMADVSGRTNAGDRDGDGLFNLFEIYLGSNPFSIDSDADGEYDPNDDINLNAVPDIIDQEMLDSDMDLWTDFFEILRGTDPKDFNDYPFKELTG